MNTTKSESDWDEHKNRLTQKFEILTNNDRMLLEGKKEKRFGRLLMKLGKTRDELHKIVTEL